MCSAADQDNLKNTSQDKNYLAVKERSGSVTSVRSADAVFYGSRRSLNSSCDTNACSRRSLEERSPKKFSHSQQEQQRFFVQDLRENRKPSSVTAFYTATGFGDVHDAPNSQMMGIVSINRDYFGDSSEQEGELEWDLHQEVVEKFRDVGAN